MLHGDKSAILYHALRLWEAGLIDGGLICLAGKAVVVDFYW